MTDADWLAAQLAEICAIAGTVHRRADALLVLSASVNIPPPVVAVTRTIPEGKGMAGLAWSRGVPVQTCDLQTDETGDVRPGAKAVDAAAAVAIPVLEGETVRAVVGFAFARTDALDEAVVAALQLRAGTLPG